MKKERIVEIVEQSFVGYKAKIVKYCISSTMELFRVAVVGNGFKVESFGKLQSELKDYEVNIIIENDVLNFVITKNYG